MSLSISAPVGCMVESLIKATRASLKTTSHISIARRRVAFLRTGVNTPRVLFGTSMIKRTSDQGVAVENSSRKLLHAFHTISTSNNIPFFLFNLNTKYINK